MILEWLSWDGRLLLAAKIARSFGYGFLSVMLGIYLKLIGIDEFRIGIIMSATLVSAAASTVVAILYADRVGRRRLLTLFAALMAISGFAFILTDDYLLLLVAVFVGTINVTGTEVGPFLSVEQAIVPQTCSEERRNTAFALYNMFGTFAVACGSLLGGLPDILQSLLKADLELGFKLLFTIYTLLGISNLFLYASLSKRVEVEAAPTSRGLFTPRSKRVVGKLSALFALDSFSGGFVLQSIVAYWFFATYNISLTLLSSMFFAANALTALSHLAAAKIADRIGLVNTMVFTHLPSNLLLMLVPLAPSAPLAVALYLARMSLSQMDVPTRQAYIVIVVNPEERTAAAGVTDLSRRAAQSVAPSISGYLLSSLYFSQPFFLAGGLKIVYDLLLYYNFRHVKPVEKTGLGAVQELSA